MKDLNHGFKRTDVLFFGSMTLVVLFILVSILFGIKPFLEVLKGQWLTLGWMFVLSVVILPTTFLPKSKWAKWWLKVVF